MKWRVVILFAAVVTGLLPGTGWSVSGSPGEDIPGDSWIYDAVFVLSTRGHFPDLLLHTRPYTRGAVAEGVAALATDASGLTQGERLLLARLQAEFHEELSHDATPGGEAGQAARVGIGPTARLDQFDGGFAKNRVGLDASGAATVAGNLTGRVRARFDSDGRHDSQFHGEYWKEHFTAWVEQAVLTLRRGHFTLAFGREYWRWARSPFDALLVSDHSPPFDGLRAVYRGRNWSYGFYATVLDSLLLPGKGGAERYLAAHRFNWRPHRRLELALSEVIVFGGVDRPWGWNYLNPLLPYYWEQLNNDTDDNPLWNLEVSYRPGDGLELYGELMIDDFQIDFVSEPQQIGGLIGAVWWPDAADGRLMLQMEFERINTFVYGQARSWNRYYHHRDLNGNVIGIGSSLGTDADRVAFRPRWHQSRYFDLIALAEFVRRGENRIDTEQEKAVPKGESFPSGVVERTLTLGLGVHGQQGGHIILDCLAGYQRRENTGHIAGCDRDGPFVTVRLSTLWWKTFGI